MDAGADERGREVRPRFLSGAASLLLSAVVAPLLIAALPATATAALTGNVLILLDRGASRRHSPVSASVATARLGAALDGAAARPAGHSVAQIGLLTVAPSRGTSPQALAARLRALPGVAAVELEHRYVPRAIPDDPAFSATDPSAGVPYQWYLTAEDFPAAWDYARAEGALVGVIDTGIDATHPDLASKIAGAYDEQDRSDARGTARTDEVGHGTHVASLACAGTDNGLGIAAAGYGCRLLIEKSDFSDSSIAASIVDATDRGVLALNMSFGPSDPSAAGPAPASEVRALQYAAAHRVVLVAAAADQPVTEQGDPGNVLQPAGTGPQLNAGIGLDVTAAAYSGSHASFAGSGSEISLAAYGAFTGTAQLIPCQGQPSGILGAYPANTTDLESFPPTACRTSIGGDTRYAYLAGTSMAAPQVSATGAMLRSLNPDATLADVLRAIKSSAHRPAGAGWTSDLGWGILDAGAAVQAIRRVDRTAPTTVLSAPRLSKRKRFLVRWAGTDVRRPGLIVSGISYYLIYVMAGARERLLARSSHHALFFQGQPGRSYTFTALAVDRAGNREVNGPRVRTRVARTAR